MGICGLNGKGKTNLLDAINYLCFTKSYFTRSDQMNVSFGTEGFRLQGYLKDGKNTEQTITCIYRANSKKEILLNNIPYEKFSQHIGKFPAVFIAPDDIALVANGSEERRKFLDTMICQIDENYLQNLITYNKFLAQRNALLKFEVQKRKQDNALLDTIDEGMIATGKIVYTRREEFTQKLFPLIQSFYDSISGSSEIIDISYLSQMHEQNFDQLLITNREKDRFTMRTNTGIHKDDIEFRLLSNSFKQIASQGQKKSLLFACKLAEYEILKQEKGFTPLLLLDDVFEKLDEKRVQNLLKFIIGQNNGQVFITDTNATRLGEAISGYHSELQIIRLE